MKQHLWAVNSFLFILLCGTLASIFLLEQPIPQHRPLPPIEEEKEKTKTPPPLEALYGPNDLFGLFVPPTSSGVKTTDIPKPPQFSPPPPPQVPKSPALKLVSPLAITISGIIFSPKHPDKSVAMIADDTNKEVMYHLGDTIKDGMIIKISQDRVVILRSNGQQETFFLRKDITLDSLSGEKADKDSEADKLARSTGENTYDLSLEVFNSKIQSVADFLDEFDLMPIYEKGEITSFKISTKTPSIFHTSLGFMDGDLVTKINNLHITDMKNRVKIYETLKNIQPRDKISVTVLRKKASIDKTITVVDRLKPTTVSLPGMPGASKDFGQGPSKQPSQMTEATYNEMIESMRSQLANNMHARAYASRIP